MKKIYSTFLFVVLLLIGGTSFAQTPVYPNPLVGICDSIVPHFNVNLTGVPDSVWISPNVNRQPTCCGDPGTGNWTFVSFTVTLDPNVAEVAVGLAPSDPGGASSGYWIDVCGTWSNRIEGGQEVCITGPGPHDFWYGKSGGNANSAYTIVQIPKPTFPSDDSVRIGCSLPLNIYGLSNITMTSGNSTYDSWLDLTDPTNPIFTPGATAPAFIDFTISGNQIASASCGAFTTTQVVRIYIFQPLNISVIPNPASFCEGGSVTLQANVSNPVGSISYSWINNSTSAQISTTNVTPPISVAGNYTVYISDVLNRYGCSPVGVTRYVTETLAPVINAGVDDTICSGDSVLLNAQISNPGSGVLWTSSTGGTFSNANILSPSYIPSATDISNGFVDLIITAYGCQDDSDTIHVTINNGPVYTVVTPTLLCNNSTGLVSVNITSGGVAPWDPISYYWSTNGVSGPSSMTLGAGTYSVTVVNKYGCGSNTPFTVTAPPALSIVMSSTDASPTGTATATVSGGTPGYTYYWENSATTFMGNTSTISGLAVDYYVATVTDANNCVISGSAVVNNPLCGGFTATAAGTDVTCFGGNDGSATVTSITGAGSVGPYSYEWLTSPTHQTTITATGLSEGVYEVIVTDDILGCMDVATAIVMEPTPITNTMTHTDNTEQGGTTGTATANPAGGTPGYTYSWNTLPIQVTQTATGLAAGLYSVTIADNNLCSITDQVLINEPPCDNFQAAVTVTSISCFGSTDGTASVIVAHATPPYTYSLDGGPFTSNPSGTFTGLSGGMHSLAVMDAKKCVVLQNFFINEPSPLSIGLSPTNMTCYGVENGTIDLSISGGTYPYSFQWINNDGNAPIGTTEDVLNLGVGTYSVTVTDNRGCSAQGSAGITQPNPLAATFNVTDITCYGNNNGAIDVTVSGGQAPYTYSWVYPSGTSTSEDLSGLSPGQYLLSITDANSCSKTNVVNTYVNEPARVKIVSTSIACPAPGGTTAIVTVDSISGGTGGPYTLAFDGTPLSQGVYSTSLTINATHTITATDGNGCTVTAPTSVTINPSVIISNIAFDPCIPAGATNINITVTPSGGNGSPYQVSTDNGGSFNGLGNYVISVPVGITYNVVVEDSLTCRSLPTTIVVPNEITTDFNVDSVSCLNGTNGKITFYAFGGTAPYNVSWSGPVSGNPAGNEINTSGGFYNITNLSAGTYTVTVTDANSCTKVTTVVVGTVVDLNNPTISCPGNISTNADLNLCTDLVNYGTPVGTDNCPGSTTIQTAGLPSGSNFPVGTTTNTFQVTDAQGRTATCSFDVTVIDAQNPSITCPATVNVNADSGNCTADSTSFALGTPTTGDNCGVASVTNNAPASFPVGATTVTWTVIDIHGNSNTCTQTVNVTDAEDPVITTCPATVNVNNNSGFCYATGVSLGTPVATDNCGVATMTSDAPASFPVGTTTVTWTVTDIHGNSVTCLQDVVVTDAENPTITCPANITQNNDPTFCGSNTVSLGTPVTGDNCGVATVTNDAPGFFPVGTTTVTWTVTDIHSNSATCTQTVTIIDNEDPVITSCPGNVSVDADAGNCAIDSANVNLGSPVVTDNCGVATITNNAPASFPVGTTTVTWTITDIHGNISTCTQTVTVTDAEDPVITTCPATVNVNNNSGFCYATGVSLGTPVATDNCGVATMTSDAPASFPVGTTTVTWTVTDIHGNSVTCLQDVVVTDAENPTITCPANITQNNDPTFCGSNTVSLGTPVTGDNCGVATVTNDAPGFFPVGTTTVTWTVTDVNGNSATCTQDVTITDDENPVIVSCAVDQNVYADGSCEFALVDYTGLITATDNCGYIVSQSPVAGTIITTGTTNVVITVNDDAGNAVTCNFNVIVSDTIDPVITNCPANISVNTDLSMCGTSVTWTAPIVTDNCGATLTSDYNSGDFFPVGTTTVTYTATDEYQNTSICTFDITVTDNENPTIVTCQSNIGSCDSLVTFSAPTATDNCGVASIVQTSGLASGSIFPVGTSIIEYTVTDVNGNTSLCAFDVTIHPTPELTLTTQDVSCYDFNNGSIDLTVISGTSPFSYNWSNNETTEDINSLAPGAYSVEVVDAFGCSASTFAEITEPSVLILSETHLNTNCYGFANGSIDLSVSGGTTPYSFNWNNSATTEDVTSLASGTYSVLVTDQNGCEDSLSVSITQPDSLVISSVTSPATCSGSDGILDISISGGTSPYLYFWSTTDTLQDLVNYPTGTYSVTVVDALGCIIDLTDSIGTISNINIAVKQKDVNCYGMATGNIDITVLNGTPPFDYNWSNGETTEDISSLDAGVYSVIVTDSNMCVVTMNFMVTEPDSLEISLYSPVDFNGYNISYNGDNTGEIQLTIIGGTTPYSILWNTGDTTNNIYDLFADTYTVVVVDDNGCTVNERIILTEPYVLAMPTGYTPNGDGQNDYFVVKGIDAYPENELQVFNRWGNMVYNEQGYHNMWNGTNNGGEMLPDGTYFVVLIIDGLDEPLTGYVDLRRSR